MKRILLILFFFSFVISVTKAQEIPSNIPTDGLVAYYPFNGNANDESGNGNHGTVYGATLTTDKDGNENSAYSFDGANDLIIVSAQSTIPSQSDYTISFWFNSPSSDHNGPFLSLQGCFLTLGHVNRPGLFYKDERGNQSNSWYVQKYFGTEPSVNTWHNLVIKKTSTNVDLYLDTSYVGNITTYGLSNFNPSSLIQFGYYVTDTDYYNGLLDDFGIWDRALSEQEIQNLYNSSSTNGGDILLNGTLSAENNQIKNVADPTEDQDAVTKSYLEIEVNSITQQNIQEVLTNGNNANGTQLKGLADPTDNQDAVTLSLLLSKIEGLQDQIDALQTQSNSGTLTDQDGNSYPYLTIKDQTWTVKNAEIATYRDGTPIPQVTDDTEWSNLTTGAWCYYDNDPTKEKLYNWYAVMGIHDNDENTPNKEFAPEGWHVPSDTEWTTLEDYLIGNGYNYDGTTTGNKIAKAMTSVTGWNNSTTEGAVGNNQNTNNSSGFNGLPIGYCNNNGLFGGKSIDAYFWSSSEFNSDTAWYSLLFNNNSNHIIDHYFSKKSGFSVRFVRN